MDHRLEHLAPISDEIIARVQVAAARILSSDPEPLPLGEMALVRTHIFDSYSFLKENIEARGGVCDQTWKEVYPPIGTYTTGCKAFCKKEVIEKQIVLETDDTIVLCNALPYSLCHLMAIPKRHIARISESSPSVSNTYRLYSLSYGRF